MSCENCKMFDSTIDEAVDEIRDYMLELGDMMDYLRDKQDERAQELYYVYRSIWSWFDSIDKVLIDSRRRPYINRRVDS